jgi:hypothetical protein
MSKRLTATVAELRTLPTESLQKLLLANETEFAAARDAGEDCIGAAWDVQNIMFVLYSDVLNERIA